MPGDWINLTAVRHQVAIAGQVSDKETNQPIGGAIVEITEMPESLKTKLALKALQYGSDWETLPERPDRTRTAVDGFFYFIDLPLGEYTLTASLPGAATRYTTSQTNVTVPSPSDNVTQPKFAFANLTLSPSGIRGKITYLQDSKEVAIAFVKVKIRDSGESTLSDDQGNFQLIGLEAPKPDQKLKPDKKRTVEMIFSAKGYQEKCEILHFGLGEVVEKNLQLQSER